MSGTASCRVCDSVAEIGASILIPVLLFHPYQTIAATEVDKRPDGVGRHDESGFEAAMLVP